MLRKIIFQAGMKKMEYKSRQWHEKCFVCCTCKNPIGTKSFIPKVINRESSVSISRPGVFNFEEYWELICLLRSTTSTALAAMRTSSPPNASSATR